MANNVNGGRPEFNVLNGRHYDDPYAAYKWLRDNDPIHWDEANELWVISRYEDVTHMSCNPETYCSKHGVRPRISAPMSIVSMDDPEHTRQRKLISRGFSPRQVRRLEPHIREMTNMIIDEVKARGEIDFVEDFAIHVPLIVIAELIGLDPATRKKLYRWSDVMMGGDGFADFEHPAVVAATEAASEYVEHLMPIIEERRQVPREDLISILTGAFDEGVLDADNAVKGHDELTSDELLMFLMVLLVAGNETTRNALSGALRAFSKFPEQQKKLVADLSLMETAVEEVLRFVTPVISFSRTITHDHEYGGKQLKEGQQVVLLYQSANRDDRVFEAPEEFRVDRSPNPHVAFGVGPHFCIGANLARLELKIVFEQLFTRLHDIRMKDVNHLDRHEHTLVLGIKHLPAIFTPVHS
jgi:cytochrome P450 family 142 subfamily A polypeptide 1